MGVLLVRHVAALVYFFGPPIDANPRPEDNNAGYMVGLFIIICLLLFLNFALPNQRFAFSHHSLRFAENWYVFTLLAQILTMCCILGVSKRGASYDFIIPHVCNSTFLAHLPRFLLRSTQLGTAYFLRFAAELSIELRFPDLLSPRPKSNPPHRSS